MLGRRVAGLCACSDRSRHRGAWFLAGLCACSDSGDRAGDADHSDSGLSFSPQRGFYDAPFELKITHRNATQVAYTLDCSDPRTSPSAVTAEVPVTISIDPNDTTGRYLAPGVVVRAFPLTDDVRPSRVSTHTYLFLDEVLSLSPDGVSPGAGWRDPGNPGQRLDYGLDPDIHGPGDNADQILAALSAVPSVSLVTPLEHLFDPGQGIYVNAGHRGAEWERPASLELLNPNGSRGLQVNAGVRIRGGYSRIDPNPKHAFRLFFREEYGAPKLEFPMFGTEGVDSFDKIDFRTSQNYSWSFQGDKHNTMNRDVFSRDLQRELGQPYTRSRYYHLYLDGVYWGLYQSQERSEARYAESYFGSDRDSYDTVKVEAGGGTPIVATDGNLDAWDEVWRRSEAGFSSDADYFALEGRDRDGQRDESLPVWVEIDNLIDYMLVIFYTGNFDGPVSAFLRHEFPTNFYAIFDRSNPAKGFVFFAHDSEHSLHVDAVGPGHGLTENRVQVGPPAGAGGEADSRYFQPQWLHQALIKNAEYRARFGRRAEQLLTGAGPMTPAATVALFDARAQKVESVIIAESARWGDAQTDSPLTQDDWASEVELLRDEWFPARTEIVIEQLREAGLYPTNNSSYVRETRPRAGAAGVRGDQRRVGPSDAHFFHSRRASRYAYGAVTAENSGHTVVFWKSRPR